MKTNESVVFTPQQIELLTKAFPKVAINPQSKMEEIMFQAGQQRVVEFISRLQQKGY